MQIGNFSVRIPEGQEQEAGHVHMRHDTPYTIELRNYYSTRRCDAEVKVDGKVIGTFRVNSLDRVRLERAPHDRGRFTFYKADTSEAQQAGVDNIATSDRGLIEVRFRAEKPWQPPVKSVGGQHTNSGYRSRGHSYPVDDVMLSSYKGGPEEETAGNLEAMGRGYKGAMPVSRLSPGMTGVSGHSSQNFTEVADLDYDSSTETVITLRLVHQEPVYSSRQEPRELTPAPRRNPVPDPV